MLTKLQTYASLYRELGLRWSAFRLAYAFRLRMGLVRFQIPQYQWDDRPLDRWLKKDIPSDSIAYTEWRKGNSPKFFFDSPHVMLSASEASRTSDVETLRYRSGSHGFWNPQTAIDEANRILNGEIKYFAHEFHQTDFTPNWHKDPVSGIELGAHRHWSQISDDHVAARRSPWHRPPGQVWFSLASPVVCLANQADVPKQSPLNRRLLPEGSQRHIDIKFIWEPNRFSFVYTLVRAYAATQDEKYAEAFWTLIEDWAQHNPPNTGPNWMDGQEIALRLMAWTFGYYAFLNSPQTTNIRISQFTIYVAAQTERIYKNIDYAISTRSNHTISEAAGLWIVGLLFPELKDSEKYLSLGRKLLEQEAATQIFPDGSYSMYSINYHRFILHIYLYAIRLGDINHFPLSSQILNSVTKSIEYLSNLIDRQTGQMPVYGSNDGALVLPLNNCDFTDYRPLLQLGAFITNGERLFEPGEWDEDVFWICGESFTATPAPRSGREPDGARRPGAHSLAPPARAGVPRAQVRFAKQIGSAGESAKPAKEKLNLGVLSELGGESSPDGGVYLLRNGNSKALIRCTDFRARPSHADQLHIDLWIHGHNIAVDAGTYLYSGEGIWRNGLAHTAVHNTVTVDGKDQMILVSRFTWTNWSKGKVLQHNEKLWQGEHDGYQPIRHKRTVMALDGDRWLVMDDLEAAEPHQYSLHWLLNDVPFTENKNSIHLNYGSAIYKIQTGLVDGESKFSILRADPNSTRGWRSRYYGHKEPAISLLLGAHQSSVTFWSFFGFEYDVIGVEGNSLKVNSKSFVIASLREAISK